MPIYTPYTAAGCRAFGKHLARHRADTRLWPPNLYEWYELKGYFGDRYGLSIPRLIDWLEYSTGYAFTKSYTAKNEITKMESWGSAVNDSLIRGRPDLAVLVAFQITGYLSLPSEEGRRVMLVEDMVEVMSGRMDPLKPELRQSN